MDDKLLFPRIEDLIENAEKTGKPQFIGFLSESESAKANEYLKHRDVCALFWGGYEGALRNFLCLSSYNLNIEAVPIVAITATHRKEDKLSHRDFLGSLMALGIKREKIGDILVEDGRAVIFADKAIADFILSQISKVGRVGVKLSIGLKPPLPEIGQKKDFCATVASARLDCVVGALIGTSRNGALEQINQSLVSINSFVCEKPTQKVFSGDKISIRKKGRFDIVSVDDISKKGRIILRYQKYF